LTKGIRKPDQKRSAKANTVPLPSPTSEQLSSFQQLKAAFSSKQFLIHDDPTVPLMMSIDASYEFGFGVTVYQVPADTMKERRLTIGDIQEGHYDRRLERVVMFLSKELTAAETSYWPTELETSALVFAIQKTRHLVESNEHPTIVYTDHVAVKHIMHSTALKTTSPERANMRLIRASQYLSQFRLDVRYRPGKENIPADALSRLKQVNTKADIFTADADIIPDGDRGAWSQIHMTDQFIKEWASALREDKHSRGIVEELEGKLGQAESVESYGWKLKRVQGALLLFIRKGEDGLRVCIPSKLVKSVLQGAHDRQAHPGIENTYAHLRDHFYMPQMSKTVRDYVASCPECACKRTARHKPYGLLTPIEPPKSPFDMITIDHIVKLPPSRLNNNTSDAILTAMDKVSRAIIFMPGKETWNAEQWADVFLETVIRRWGVPKAVISDRGSVMY
jgi:hypothetical protein